MASLAGKRLFLLDMDGTLYLDDRLFPKVPEFLSLIRRRGGDGRDVPLSDQQLLPGRGGV